MSYTFRVIFNGVLAYVPDKPFFVKCENMRRCCTTDDTESNSARKTVCYDCPPDEGCWKRRADESSEAVRSLAVLLPDLRRPGNPKVPNPPHRPCDPHAPLHCPPLNFPKFREPHFPLLRFRLSDLRESTTRRVDLVCRDISRQDEEGILFLRREQIRFKMEAENAASFSYADWAPCPPPRLRDLRDCCYDLGRLPKGWGITPDLRDRNQLESLWWLPDLDRIITDDTLKAATKVKPDFLPSYRGPFPEGLIARIECSGGRLRTFDFNRGVDGLPFTWRFAPPDDAVSCGTWNRALANSLALEFFDVRNEVRIELKRLANEVVTEELVLAPAPGASRPLLEIEITNREPDLLFEGESFNRASLPDMDFQPFYELLSNAKPCQLPCLPIPNPGTRSFFGVVEKPCAGGAMQGQGG